MGLFDFLSKSEKNKPQAPAQTSLEEYSGMRVEVLSKEFGLLFLARMSVDGRSVELYQLTESAIPLRGENGPEEAGEGEAPEPTAPDPIHVLLRGFEERVRLAVHMECDIIPQGGAHWRVKGLQVLGKDNDRAFYRQDVGTDGEVMLIGKAATSPDIQKCRVVNISAGGACIRTGEVFETGDKLLLKSRLLPDSEMKPLFCVIRRVTPRRGGEIEYGCQFSDLDPVMEDEIAKAILKLQMARIKR